MCALPIFEIIPWAWGVNGACSVLGSVVAMVVAMSYGLAATLAVGGLYYVLGIGVLLDVRRGETEAAA